MRKVGVMVVGAALAVAQPGTALAGWKVMPTGQPAAVAKSGLTVTPRGNDWNRWSARPSKRSEIWTLDGTALNELSFFAGVADGEPLYRERDKKNRPLPKFRSAMLLPDVVQMFEASNRIVLDTSLFEVESIEPARFLGSDGVRFTYHYTAQADEVRRKGVAVASIVGGKLYLINFAAPAIHYYDASVDEVLALMENARL